MKKASQTNWLANINPNSQTAVCQVRLCELIFKLIRQNHQIEKFLRR